MDRRSFLQAGVAATAASAGYAAPALSQGAAARTLRFVPQANLANFDPIWGTQYVVRNAAAAVWDTLYGVDENLVPQPQMIEGETVSADGLTWEFRLRPGLMFHDGAPVLAKDVVASINRWAPRDPMGQMIRAIQDELVAVDDRNFRWKLRRPYSKLKYALGKTGTPCCFIMPERIAATAGNSMITEYVGSGPMSFKRDEWVPGARAVFERAARYTPREGTASWLAGPKRIMVDRLEWVVMPDPATASAALQNGEVDWWESPISDLIPLLRRNRNVLVDIADPLGNIGSFRMNHLHAPFNNLKVRQAVMMALSQEDYMRALVGNDTALWSVLGGFFTPGTPSYSEAGGEVMKRANMEGARRLLAESGYANEPVTCLVAQDQPLLKPMGEVTADVLRRLGMNVDFVATDWGTVGQRRAMRNPPGQGGWSMFHTWHAGADCVNPAGYNAVRANGEGAWFGWPSIPSVEAGITEWFDAPTPALEKAAIDKINREAVQNVVYSPTGFFKSYQAWRRNVSGIQKGPLPFFWGVSKS
ncbi:ABC transporter substrate-binding protein [Sediminicoccus sp. KRV36]|uniref:ABC transporter substrate-binding protein n=1 Tax=Sediminicoccus sp. KRV36 TaxID=3133721 RepID=UPI00200C80FA|nr:ABC transporter substrate-binding protein [Sediminicoccus rosea]UPY39005.1 ABC transporter substrate-binding protein [Sediminicoccus rosea]